MENKVQIAVIGGLLSLSGVLIPKTYDSINTNAEERGRLKAKVELREEFDKEYADKNESLTTRLIDTRTELAICKEGVR